MEGLLGTFPFFLHASVNALATVLDVGLDKLEVILVPDNDIGLPYCFQYGRGDVFLTARTNACDDDSSHGVYLFRFFQFLQSALGLRGVGVEFQRLLVVADGSLGHILCLALLAQ